MKRAHGIMLVSVAATLLYLGLAILGRGGLAAFFAQPALSTVAVVMIVLCAVGLLSEGNLSAGEQEDRGNRWVFLVFTVVGFASAYVPAYTDRIDFWTIDGDGVRWFGVF